MATIEELDFRLILDDKDFNSQIEKVKKTAKELNTELSKLLKVKKNSGQMTQKEYLTEKRLAALATQRATNEESVRQAKEKTAQAQARTAEASQREALAQQKVTTEAQRTYVELEKVRQAETKTAAEAVKLQTEEQKLAKQTAQREAAEIRLKKLKEQQTNEVRRQSSLIDQMSGLAAGIFSVYGAERLVKSLVRITGEFEMQRTTLRAILQDTAGADKLFNQIKELAVVSPFSFKDLTSYAKQLSAFSIPMEELYDTTKMLADVSAGLGVDMSRIILAYGQIRSASFLRGQEVRQLTEAGVPILTELAKQFETLEGRAVSAGEVFDKISKRQVSFEMVAKVFRDMTSEGGKFYNMQEVQAATLQGKLSNLRDAYEILFSEIGQTAMPMLKGSVQLLTNLTKHTKMLSALILPLLSGLGSMAAVILTAKAATAAWGAAIGLLKLPKLAKELGSMKKALAEVGMTGTAAIGGLVGILTTVATLIATIVLQTTQLRRELNGIAGQKNLFAIDKAQEAERQLAVLNKLLGENMQGTNEYREAIEQFNRSYGDYLDAQLTESDTLDEIIEKTRNLTDEIYNRAKAEAYEQGVSAIEQDYGNKISKALQTAMKGLDAAGIGKDAAREFMKSYRENIENSDIDANPYTVLRQSFEDYFPNISWGDMVHKPSYTKFVAGAYDLADLMHRMKADSAEFSNELDIMFGRGTRAANEEEVAVRAIEKAYRDKYDELRKGLQQSTIDQNKFNSEVDSLKTARVQALIDKYIELGYSIEEARRKAGAADDWGELESGWQVLANTVSSKIGYQGGQVQDGEEAIDYVKRLAGAFKGAKEEINMFGKGNNAFSQSIENAKKRLENIETIAKALGVDIEKIANPKTYNSHGQSEEEKADKAKIANLKEQVRQIRSLKKEYEDLSKILDAKTIQVLFGEHFGDTNFDERYQQVIKDLSAIGHGGAEAAVALKIAFDNEQVEDYIRSVSNAKQALSSYRTSVDDWLTEDFNIDGEGIAFDLSKILTGLNTQNTKVDKQVSDFAQSVADALKNATDEQKLQLRGLLGADFWDEYIVDAEGALKKIADREKEYNRKVAAEKVRDLAKKWASEEIFENDLQLKDWGDKSLKQIRQIRAKLKEMMSDEAIEAVLPESLVDAAEKLGIDLDSLIEQFREILTSKDENAKEEELKKIQATSQAIISQTGQLNNAIGEIGESLDNKFLKGLSDAVGQASEFAGIMTDFASSFKLDESTGKYIADSSDWITMIVKVIALAIEQLGNVISMKSNDLDMMADAAWNYKAAMDEIARSNYGTIFGTDSLGLLRENYQKATDAAKNYQDTLDEMMAKDAKMGGLGGQQIKNLQALLSTVFNDEKGNTFTFRDEYGGLDIEKLKQYYEYIRQMDARGFNGWTISKKFRRELDELLAAEEDFAAQESEWARSVEDIFGSLASDIADNLIDAFLETGDAVSNLEDAFDNLGGTVLRTFLQSFLIEKVLNVFKAELDVLLEQAAKGEISDSEFEKGLSDWMSKIGRQLSVYGDYLNEVLQAALDAGWLEQSDLSDNTQNLAEGIKGITEDTADLLASYLNAIRADVSFNKGQLTAIGNDVRLMLGLLPSAPTLSDYLQQIQANTYQSAARAQDILARLDNVLDTSMGIPAFRTLNI